MVEQRLNDDCEPALHPVTVSWEEKRILITGINGFLGKQISSQLRLCGAEVFGFGRNSSQLNQKFISSFFAGNIDNYDSLFAAITTSQPDVIIHLAAQSSVAESFHQPVTTCQTNCLGTSNLLDIVRRGKIDPVILFAGSSDEYGQVFSTPASYQEYVEKYGEVECPPEKYEIPIAETNPLRPLSPYAITKVFGDLLMRNYHKTYGLKTIVCRSFNIEGAGRGDQYVTSVIARQVSELKGGKLQEIQIGNINPIRDFSHVDDIVNGYLLLAHRGKSGNVYNLGSMNGVSIATYLLRSLEIAGYPVDSIRIGKIKKISSPLTMESTDHFGVPLTVSRLDNAIMKGELSFTLSDGGFSIRSRNREIPGTFDRTKFRPADIPILIADTRKISSLGYQPEKTISDIIADQLRYYQNKINAV